MKRISLSACVFALALGVSGQGTVNFANLSSDGVQAPVSNSDGTRLRGPSTYVADLFYSTDTNRWGQLKPAGFNVGFSTSTALGGGGWFLGGTRTIPGVTGIIVAQVRVWDTACAPTYEEALEKPCGLHGVSSRFLIKLGNPGEPAPGLVGLISFMVGALYPPPWVSKNPTSQSANAGSTVSFTVEGSRETGYVKWYFNQTNLLRTAPAPEGRDTLVLVNVQSPDSGSYSAICYSAWDGSSSFPSQPANLNVIQALTTEPVQAIAVFGGLGESYRLEFTDSLGDGSSWTSLQTVTITNRPQYEVDLSASGKTARFYRLAQP